MEMKTRRGNYGERKRVRKVELERKGTVGGKKKEKLKGSMKVKDRERLAKENQRK